MIADRNKRIGCRTRPVNSKILGLINEKIAEQIVGRTRFDRFLRSLLRVKNTKKGEFPVKRCNSFKELELKIQDAEIIAVIQKGEMRIFLSLFLSLSLLVTECTRQ